MYSSITVNIYYLIYVKPTDYFSFKFLFKKAMILFLFASAFSAWGDNVVQWLRQIADCLGLIPSASRTKRVVASATRQDTVSNWFL